MRTNGVIKIIRAMMKWRIDSMVLMIVVRMEERVECQI
jgi:hypothetical protein